MKAKIWYLQQIRKRVGKEWNSLTNKIIQVYSKSINNRIESCLLLKWKITKYLNIISHLILIKNFI